MQIEPALLAEGWRTATLAAAVPLLAFAAATAPWRGWLVDHPDRQHVWLGSIVLTIVIWSMRAGITPGLSVQFLLASTLTLMHGWRLALVAIAVVLGAQGLLQGGWSAWGANFLCFGLAPVAVVALLHRSVERWLPHNYFIYFFVTVFLGSILAFNVAGFARLALLHANGTLPVAAAGSEYLVFLPMLSVAEAFVNGVMMSMAVIYRPEWVATFDDGDYFPRR